ncbi:MAG: flagellin lysine-N-methylase [Oscillospiraceae bacterium]|nr:flagellin lysine-N-methylase [Oscillospiraceae bacterium]
MKFFAPDYYCDFKCIAGDCRHSCCIGWEIDIDSDIAEYYQDFPGEFGERLRINIDFGEAVSSFRLCENERCPFLNKKGLCDIILTAGEESLCQICDDHPRFRNFFSERTEIGLGLCCEAAAKLILERKSKTKLAEIDSDGEDLPLSEEEKEFLAIRKRVFEIIQNRDITIEERIEKMLGLCKAKLPQKSFAEWAGVFEELERLDEEWTETLAKIKTGGGTLVLDPVPAEQLLWYFVFRHLSGAVDDGRLAERAAFAVLSFRMVEKAAEYKGILEAARLYSSEIEYSDENIEALLDIISAENEVQI